MSPTAPGVDRIRRLAQRAERRIRAGRTLRVLAQALSLALLAAIAIVALRKVGALSETVARVLLAVSAAPVVLAAVSAWVWRLPEKAGARALDRFHGLHDRLASALAFAEIGEAERTPFMRAAMADAAASTQTVAPRKAVPVAFPRALLAAGPLAALLVGVSLFEVRRHVPVAHAKTIDAIEMAPDDLQDVKDFLKQEEQRESSDDAKAAVEEFNKLVDDIAERRLDRTEAFRRMEVLEQKFLTSDGLDKKALERRLEGLGDELKKAELSRPAGRALADDDLAKAEASLHELAKKMRAQDSQVDKAKLDELRQALKRAAEERQKNADALARRRDQLADEILKLKEKMTDGETDEERSLLDKKKEELDRLDRDAADPDKKNEQRQTLDRLDRDIQQAAEDLLRDLGASAQDLDQGAEDLNHLQEQQMTQQEKEELRQKLQEMRELLRQQGQGGKGQMLRLKRFARMARGEGGSRGESGNGPGGDDRNGQQGQEQGQGQNGQQGPGSQQGQGPGQNGQGGQGSQGKGAGQGGETWVVGPNGEKLLLLSRGSGQEQGGSQPGQGGEGEGRGQPGSWGEGHDPNVQGKATAAKMGTEETHVEGSDTGQGSSRSQVIQGAAERGFASGGYRKVYTEYHQVAEESLAKDDIPDGYRSFVKRYFQLIRPREQP